MGIPTIFQSTLPREERRYKPQQAQPRLKFQSTLPREERRSKIYHIKPKDNHFNPRSHERSDGDIDCNGMCGRYISIHAPTRGATFWIKHKGYNFYISIHAPTRGATSISIVINVCYIYFNPRSHERSDEGL